MTKRLCVACSTTERFGHSRACFRCLRRAQLVVDVDRGEPIGQNDDGRGNLRKLAAARYLYKRQNCGTPRCKRCAVGDWHRWYVYRVWFFGGKLREDYVGPADHKRGDYDFPSLRPPERAFGARTRPPVRSKDAPESGGRPPTSSVPHEQRKRPSMDVFADVAFDDDDEE